MIFAIALRGLGSHTKSGSVYLTAAISGGAIFPVIMDPVSGPDGMYVGYSFCVVVAACVAGAIFPAYTCIVPKARNQVDPIYNTSKTPLPIANTPDLDISHREKKPPGGLWPRKKKDSGIGIEHVEGSGTSEPPSRLPVTNRLPGL